MAVVGRKLADGRTTVYWIAFYVEGKQVWERVGTDKREAQVRERQRKKDVADGTYGRAVSPSMTFGAWLRLWMAKRTNRNAKDDARIVERFMLARGWLRDLPCADMSVVHTKQLVREWRSEKARGVVDGKRGQPVDRPLSEKYIANLYGLYRSAVQDAVDEGLVKPDVIRRNAVDIVRSSGAAVRQPYTPDEVRRLLACPEDAARAFVTLALLTGMRKGEVCGRRWRDWDRSAKPLGCLILTDQYDGQKLKTEWGKKGRQPRKIPVLPALELELDYWWRDGFRLAMGRAPTEDDFIVPRTADGKPHTKSTGYKLFRRACAAVGVKTRSMHSTRHTFVTFCRRGGAPGDVVEKITHSAKGQIVDQYTHLDWATLCNAVMCLDSAIDPRRGEAGFPLQDGAGAGYMTQVVDRQFSAFRGTAPSNTAHMGTPILPQIPSHAARPCASQENSDPPTPTIPEVLASVVTRARAAVSAGDEASTLDALAEGAAALMAGKASP